MFVVTLKDSNLVLFSLNQLIPLGWLSWEGYPTAIAVLPKCQLWSYETSRFLRAILIAKKDPCHVALAITSLN